MHNELAKRIAAKSRQLHKVTGDLCALLTEAAQAACDAGHITSETATLVVEPKDPPK